MSEEAAARPSALALVVILSAQLLVVLDFSIVNVALPSIQGYLGFSTGGTQWVVTAYAMTFGGLLMVGGRAGDMLGPRGLSGRRPSRATSGADGPPRRLVR
jgi:MFS family permease